MSVTRIMLDQPTEPLGEDDLQLIEYSLPGPDVLPKLFRHRATLSPQDVADEVSTLGWDTTYVLRVTDVNSVLKTSTTVPTTFSQEVDKENNYAISGTFGKWQMALGGSGGIVFFSVPITTGTMTSGANRYSLDNSTAYISLKLEYVPQVPKKGHAHGHANGTPNGLLENDDLQVRSTGRSEADPAVVVQNLTFTGTPPSTFVRALMVGALQEWFQANIIKFAYIFATVSLNDRAAEAAFQWLKPTYTGYAYQDGNAEEGSYFAVLSKTDNRSPQGLTNQVAPGSVPGGSRAGFNIAMPLYIEKVIMPGLVKGFPHATASSFTLSTNNTVIENTEPIECEKVRVNGLNYTPYIHEFVLQVVGNEIQVYTKTVTDVSPGIRSVVISTSYQTIVVVKKPDGTQTLDFEQSQPPRTTSFIDKDEWVLITEIIVSLVGAIAGAVAAKVITGAVKIILACVVIAIVFGLAAATPALIAAVAGGGAAAALPPVTLLLLNATSPVQWPKAANFTLDTAQINGAFQLGGDPHITPTIAG
ncbi:MAG TPA: TULIP family P47-like protein [Pseudonocardiaceae bacterium]|jgi:hypothetical protein|nr:TULIP family P47-like protein [Pseudonocardiaceae bacterium]